MILLLGGTLDSRKIAEELTNKHIDFVVSTVSEYGKDLALLKSENVVQEVLTEEKLSLFVKKKDIDIIIDATHPFAQVISANAIKVSKNLGIDYYRFEREDTENEIDHNEEGVFFVESMDEAVKKAEEIGENILLTIGSRQLHMFKGLVDKKNIYARVLPEIKSIEECKEIDLTPANIIAIQGPFSKEFNKALIKEKDIDLLITKASGKTGGVDTKILAAKEMQINVIVISKPKIKYPNVYFTVDELIKKMEECI